MATHSVDLRHDLPPKPPAGRGAHDLTQGPIGQHVVQMSLPMIIGIFAIIGFNVADTYFIAQLGVAPLAAISLTFPVVASFGSLTIGLGVGVASVISRASGQGDRERVQTLTTHALLLAILIVGVFVVLGFSTIDWLFLKLGAKPAMLPLVHAYMQIWYMGILFLVIPIVGNSAIRAIGDARFPAVVMVIAGVANVVLDPILIFGYLGFPALGLRGAAIATVISRMLTLLAALWVLHFREGLIRWEIPKTKELFASWKEILYIGIPSAANQLVGPLSLGIITSLLSVFGATTLAAFGVVTRIESLSMIGIFAVSAGIAPIVGQNWGAQAHGRVRKAVQIGFIFSMIYGLALMLALVFFADPLIALFNSQATPAQLVEIKRITHSYLWTVPVSYGSMGVFMISNSAFNAMGKPGPASALTVMRAFVLYIPLALLGRSLFQAWGIFLAACVANFLAGAAAFTWNRLSRQACVGDQRVEQPVVFVDEGKETET